MPSLASRAFTLTAPERVPEPARLLVGARAHVAERIAAMRDDWERVEQAEANAWLVEHTNTGRRHGFVRAAVREGLVEISVLASVLVVSLLLVNTQ